MAKEEERKGYCTTKGKISDREIERQSYKSDVVIAIENRETIGDELLKPLAMSTKSNEAQKADMMQWCNDIKKSCTFGFLVLLFLIVGTVLSFLCYILFRAWLTTMIKKKKHYVQYISLVTTEGLQKPTHRHHQTLD